MVDQQGPAVASDLATGCVCGRAREEWRFQLYDATCVVEVGPNG
jgi:hypothetical protein